MKNMSLRNGGDLVNNEAEGRVVYQITTIPEWHIFGLVVYQITTIPEWHIFHIKQTQLDILYIFLCITFIISDILYVK